MNNLSVVIPAYNEEKRIIKTLEKVTAFLADQLFWSEIIIVDDFSSDKTKEVVRNFRNNSKKINITIVEHSVNQGKGASVKTGMLKAKNEFILFMDADSSTDISEITKLMPYINKYPIVIGSRYLEKGSVKIKQPFIRKLISRAGNLLIKVSLGLNFEDTQCGFKIFSHNIAQKIFNLVTVERWGFDIEILTIAKNLKIPVKEVAITWYDDPNSRLRAGRAMTETLKELFHIIKNLNKGKYDL